MTPPTVQVTAVAQASGASAVWAEYVKAGIAAAFGAAGAVGASWLQKRVHPKMLQAETSERIANAFDGLVDRLQADNKRLSDRLGDAEAKVQSIRKDLQDRNNFIDVMRDYVRGTLNYASQLETLVLHLGGALPERPVLPDLPKSS